VTPEDRAWEVVRRAFEERTPSPRRRRAGNRLLLAGVAALGAAAVGIAVVTPPGHAVLERVRRAVGIENAAPALGSLPARGRLLVVAPGGGGAWVVNPDGLKRRLGDYDDATWSPHGLYVVATTRTDLVALDVGHGVRWSLPRPGAFWPRWEGTLTDTRIAYMTPGGLRVVAGDGTGDKLLDRHPGQVAPAWDPLRLHTLAYLSGKAIVLRDTDSGRTVWRSPLSTRPTALAWSSDGRLLAVVSPHRIALLDAAGHVLRTYSALTERFVDAAFRPASDDLAVSVRQGDQSRLTLVHADGAQPMRVLFAGPGRFGDFAWSPDGRWLLVDWPTANQWLFLHGSRVRAVANIERQFPRPDQAGPGLRLDGRWCCAASR
jgi:dipeptidyl aminopeptidase/acylaminoacyl peptidase